MNASLSEWLLAVGRYKRVWRAHQKGLASRAEVDVAYARAEALLPRVQAATMGRSSAPPAASSSGAGVAAEAS